MRFAVAVACTCGWGIGVGAADWEWTIAPYAWATDVSLDLSANNEPVLGADIGVSDILDKTDFVAMLHFEGRRGRAGFFVDGLYLSTSDEQTTTPAPPLPGGTHVDSEVDTRLYEAGGFYRLLEDRRVLDVLGGARVIDLDQQHDITLPGPLMQRTRLATSDTLLDGLVGLRFDQPFGERFDFLIRADVGAGDTDITWNGLGTFGLRLGQTGKYKLRLGWRHTYIETEERSTSGIDVKTELTLTGPLVGFVIEL
jgi:hypothetical protein